MVTLSRAFLFSTYPVPAAAARVPKADLPEQHAVMGKMVEAVWVPQTLNKWCSLGRLALPGLPGVQLQHLSSSPLWKSDLLGQDRKLKCKFFPLRGTAVLKIIKHTICNYIIFRTSESTSVSCEGTFLLRTIHFYILIMTKTGAPKSQLERAQHERFCS